MRAAPPRHLAPVPFDDAALTRAAQDGDRAAIGALYDRHAPHVRRIAARVLGPSTELSDVVHDVFRLAIERLSELREPARVRGWLATITVHVSQNALRSRRRRRWLIFSAPEELPERTGPTFDPARGQLMRHAYAALARIPDEERIAFVLRHFEGMELTEAAEVASTSLATFKRRLARAEASLREIAKEIPCSASSWRSPMGEWERLSARVTEELDDELASRDDLAEARARLLAAPVPESVRPRARRARWPVVVGAAAIAATAALAFYLRAPPTDPIVSPGVHPPRFGLESHGLVAQRGGWVETAEASSATLRFEDASVVSLEPGSELTVTDTRPEGASVRLGRGRLRAAVEHRDGTSWSFQAGPYTVAVVGTRFDLAWDPGSAELELTMHEGGVELRFGSDSPIPVRAPQTLRAWAREGRIELQGGEDARALEPERGGEPPPEPREAAAPPAPPRETRRSRVSETRPDPFALARDGRHLEAVEAAESLGFESTLRSASAGDVLALADAARLADRPERARAAYASLRSRFPGTPQAARAAFGLGRVALEQDASVAARWFRTYAEEEPRGSLAREARGRWLEAARRAGDEDEARSAAAAYLRADPDGPHAAHARSVLGAGEP